MVSIEDSFHLMPGCSAGRLPTPPVNTGVEQRRLLHRHSLQSKLRSYPALAIVSQSVDLYHRR